MKRAHPDRAGDESDVKQKYIKADADADRKAHQLASLTSKEEEEEEEEELFYKDWRRVMLDLPTNQQFLLTLPWLAIPQDDFDALLSNADSATLHAVRSKYNKSRPQQDHVAEIRFCVDMAMYQAYKQGMNVAALWMPNWLFRTNQFTHYECQVCDTVVPREQLTAFDCCGRLLCTAKCATKHGKGKQDKAWCDENSWNYSRMRTKYPDLIQQGIRQCIEKNCKSPCLEGATPCGRCQRVSYCSKQCEDKDSERHRAECKTNSSAPR
jgi:hypothetical protein